MLPPRIQQQQQQQQNRRRNFWFIIWTIPVFIVLFVLPIQQEIEERGGSRSRLEDRLAVLAKHPIDFVVVPARWSIPIKQQALKPHLVSTTSGTGTIPSSASQCFRLVGLNKTLNNNPVLRKSLPRIKTIRIIGERNTGARILKADLTKAFRNISIENGVTRWGYWFQDPTLLDTKEHRPEETLVIHVVLDPYQWIARMQANPIHAPNHKKPHDGSNWTQTTFLKRPWIMKRPDWDDVKPAIGHCQYRFPYGSVIPCLPAKYLWEK